MGNATHRDEYGVTHQHLAPRRWFVAAAALGLAVLTGCQSSPGQAGQTDPPATDDTAATAAEDATSTASADLVTATEPPTEQVAVTQAPTDAPGAGHDADTAATTSEPPEDLVQGLDQVDLGELEWVFRHGGNSVETVALPFEDGETTVGLVTYTLDEVLHVDLTGDGVIDAAGRISAVDGNAVDIQWYLWVATEDGPVQVTLPVARASRCGDTIRSVTVVDGGIEIHERRRHIGEAGYLPCAEEGTDERKRTVAAIPARHDGEWWPAQVGPEPGFGGLCPVATDFHAYPHESTLYVAPDSSTEVATSEESGVFPVEEWPVYGEDFPGWRLLGVMGASADQLRCAWVEVD